MKKSKSLTEKLLVIFNSNFRKRNRYFAYFGCNIRQINGVKWVVNKAVKTDTTMGTKTLLNRKLLISSCRF